MVIIAEDNEINIENVSERLCVSYGPDMFYEARTIIAENGYAVAKDEVHRVLLKNQDDLYIHSYCYSGGADLWFIEQYDCIFLHDCNEFSVELCQSALKLWKGKRLVLVGKYWGELIPMLPDLDVECWYEEMLTQERLDELSAGMKCLHVIYGLPHEEPMDRFEKGIMYYDEVMSFTFMFSDYRELGELNDDKNFFVLNGYYSGLGLFAILSKAESCVRYVKSKGFIPVVSLTGMGNSFYADYDGDDVWSKFFNQPEGYTLEEVMHSKHVFFSPLFYNGSVQSRLMDRFSDEKSVVGWPDGVYNKRVQDYISDQMLHFLPYPDRTLGVLARGTDYVKTHLPNHAVHANLDMLYEKIDEALDEWQLDYIYVATEDASYCRSFRERYGDRVFFTDQKRYEVEEGELLSDLHRREEKRDGFTMGMEYILSIYLLSRCESIIASGGCGGLYEALKENNGRYRNVYVFDLGVNK